MSYDDIINLPHYVSKKRPQMSILDRSAQFSPFSALTGFEEELAESNRQVEQFADFDENYLQELDEKLRYIQENLAKQPQVEVTYFVPDAVKQGGSYKTVIGAVKKIDKDNRLLIFADKQAVDIRRVTAINILR